MISPRKWNNKIVPELPSGRWAMSIHMHKRYGDSVHYDIMLSPPDEKVAFRWASRKFPFSMENIEMFRVKDDVRKTMSVNTSFRDSKGKKNLKKLIYSSDVVVIPIMDDALLISGYDGHNYVLSKKSGQVFNLRRLSSATPLLGECS